MTAYVGITDEAVVSSSFPAATKLAPVEYLRNYNFLLGVREGFWATQHRQFE